MKKPKILILQYTLSFVLIFVFGLCTRVRKENSVPDDTFISFEKDIGNFVLFSDGKLIPVCVHYDDFPGVMKISQYLVSDLEKVTGQKPALFTDEIPANSEAIIIGTIGKSPLINHLVEGKKIDVSDIEGKWESSLIQVINEPFEGMNQALVIAGSDKRGTIYGILELSKQIGVSPWYWWADVPVIKQENISVKTGRYTFGEPKVKYRGIFLNDEEPALGRWAVKYYGGFTHEFYEKVFELILRLKGNYLWPAMWWASFNSDDTLNPVIADELGIVMGTSHHEPMMRAHAEWQPWGGGEWDYSTNKNQLDQFWREGIARMGKRESIVTIGMRGDGDMAMSEETNISLLETIVSEQRSIIEDVTGKSAEDVPQLWALYKEVQDYYDKGMRVPDDVTLLLCDDNWGNVRKLPDVNDPPREGGYGMYYHFDFVGGPRNYKWLNTNPIPRIWEQMHLTYKNGVDRIWLVNVGDLKPMELPISFFLDYAWDPDKWPASRIDEYHLLWAKQQFGETYAKDISEMLEAYTKYNGRRTPELLNSETYSLENYREFETVVKEYNDLEERARDIYDHTDPDLKDAFYQLVYHPVQASANLNNLYYYHALNLLYAEQGRGATNDMADRVEELFQKDAEITEFYHNELSGGKWDHMMAQTHIGYTSWQQPSENIMPEVVRIELPDSSNMGVAVEGSRKYWPGTEFKAELPVFDSYNEQKFYIEIFNRGKSEFDFEIIPAEEWIIVSRNNGKIRKQIRIEISIDWSRLKPGQHTADLEIRSNKNEQVNVTVNAFKYDKEARKADGFVERNGYVSMEAAGFSRSVGGAGLEWEVIPGFGKTRSGITTVPVTRSTENPGVEGPVLEYSFFIPEIPKNGKLVINVYFAPTLNFKSGDGLRYAISIDDEEPKIVNIHEGMDVPDWEYPQWFNEAVSNKIIIKSTTHSVEEEGNHVLKYRAVDNGVVPEKIVVDTGGLRPSYLGPPESIKLQN